jgi:hypothetical protein
MGETLYGERSKVISTPARRRRVREVLGRDEKFLAECGHYSDNVMWCYSCEAEYEQYLIERDSYDRNW